MFVPTLWTRLTARAATLALKPFVRSHDFIPPRKALILKPCCLSQVLLTTPLLQVLSRAYPKAQFDWAVSEWSRPGVATNERITKLIDTGRVGLPNCTWSELLAFAQQLRQHEYDTCFIPSRSPLLGLVAWHAHIPQRVGLNMEGLGFGHTMAVPAPAVEHNTTTAYLHLAEALGLDTSQARMEFFPTNAQRSRVMELLLDVVQWHGDVPLVIIHPGGGTNPVYPNEEVRWPVERFARLGNYLVREHHAKLLLVGGDTDQKLAADVAGMMSGRVVNLAGRLDLGEIGALGEVANLYIGNDSGPSHVAAAVGCPTLIIYGANDGRASRPYVKNQQLTALWQPYEGEFTWQKGVSTEQVIQATRDILLQQSSLNKVIL
jgi:ADP-heptose:LPS heptosyltransferase